jgi:uncharacterized protein
MTEPASPRVRVRRGPKKGRYDRASINEALDRNLVAHVAFVDDGDPFCIPMLYARVDTDIYVHGSTASRTMRALDRGAAACVTVTTIRGLVLARSVFEHSANYESVMIFGSFHRLSDGGERDAALEALTNALVPGRWKEVRGPDRKELKATTLLAMTIKDAVVKVRSGPPDDGDSPDAATDIWAGVIPIVTSFGVPQPSPELRVGIPVPASVKRLLAQGARGVAAGGVRDADGRSR